MLKSQQDNITNSPDPTISPAALSTLALTSSPEEGLPIPDPEPSAYILHPYLMALTTPRLITTNTDILVPAQSAPSPPPTLSPVLDSLEFGPRIEEALPYTTMYQVTYLPPAATPGDNIVATAKATTREIHCAPSIIALIISK